MIRPDEIEPYSVHLGYVAGSRLVDAPALLASLLDDIGLRCDEAGASLLGHIKCYVRGESLRFHCNLTSLRAGARCRAAGAASGSGAPAGVALPPLAPGGTLEVDLAVLVYGLSRRAVERAVSEAMAASEETSGGTWQAQPALGVACGHAH